MSLKFTFSRNDWTFPVFEILLRVSEGDTWQKAFLKVLPERKNARPIISVQSKGDESQDSKLVDVNNAVLADIGNTVPVDSKTVDVNNTMPVDVNNAVSITVNNTLTVIKDIKESDIKSERKVNSKDILNESSCIT